MQYCFCLQEEFWKVQTFQLMLLRQTFLMCFLLTQQFLVRKFKN